MIFPKCSLNRFFQTLQKKAIQSLDIGEYHERSFEAAHFPNHKKLKTNFWKISPRTFILARLKEGTGIPFHLAHPFLWTDTPKTLEF